MSSPIEDPTRLAEERIDVAESKGLPRHHAKRLKGSTRQQLEADADALVSELGLSGGQQSRSDEELVFGSRRTRG